MDGKHYESLKAMQNFAYILPKFCLLDYIDGATIAFTSSSAADSNEKVNRSKSFILSKPNSKKQKKVLMEDSFKLEVWLQMFPIARFITAEKSKLL